MESHFLQSKPDIIKRLRNNCNSYIFKYVPETRRVFRETVSIHLLIQLDHQFFFSFIGQTIACALNQLFINTLSRDDNNSRRFTVVVAVLTHTSLKYAEDKPKILEKKKDRWVTMEIMIGETPLK